VVTLYGLGQPSLDAAVSANGQLNFYWPPTANGFLLQSTTNLANSLWTNVGSAQITTNGFTNGLVSVSVAPNSGLAFYRLQQP